MKISLMHALPDEKSKTIGSRHQQQYVGERSDVCHAAIVVLRGPLRIRNFVNTSDALRVGSESDRSRRRPRLCGATCPR